MGLISVAGVLGSLEGLKIIDRPKRCFGVHEFEEQVARRHLAFRGLEV
jgi:hypothetical protein